MEAFEEGGVPSRHFAAPLEYRQTWPLPLFPYKAQLVSTNYGLTENVYQEYAMVSSSGSVARKVINGYYGEN